MVIMKKLFRKEPSVFLFSGSDLPGTPVPPFSSSQDQHLKMSIRTYVTQCMPKTQHHEINLSFTDRLPDAPYLLYENR